MAKYWRQQTILLLCLLLGTAHIQMSLAQVIQTPVPVTTSTPTPTPGRSSTTTPAATPTPTPRATPASTPTSTPAATQRATPASTPATTPTSTPAATPAPTPKATPAPESPTPVATPAPAPPVQAPPPPLNPNATALTATLQMSGVNLWPFSSTAAAALVNTLAQTLTTVTISGINVVNVTQAGSKRRSRTLLQDKQTVNAVLELEGSSPAAALSINQDLGTAIFGGNLQKTLARNGLVVQSLSLIYSNSAVPQSNYACNSGSFSGTCIANLNHSWSTGKIVAVAAGTGAGVLILIALTVVCVLRCVSKKATKKAQQAKPQKVMTPQYAQPYWETNNPQGINGGTLSPVGPSIPNDHVEHKEMGGRLAREQLKMKLPEFAARTHRPTSGIPGISRTTSAISRTNSNVGGVSRTTSQATCIVHD